MTTLSKKPISLSKNKTRKNIRNVWNFYDQIKATENEIVLETASSNSQIDKLSVKDDTHEIQNECCKDPCNLMVAHDGYITCSKCSFTKTDIIDASPEWRFYGTDDSGPDPNRCGMPSTPFIENNLTCSVGCSGYQAKSRAISTLIRYTNSSNFSHKDKTFMDDSHRLSRLGSVANFTQRIVDHAIIIHKKVINYLCNSDVHFRADNKDSILFGDFDLACKLLDVPRTAKEFSALWNCDIQIVTSGCKIVQTVYTEIEQDIHDSLKITSKHTYSSSFIPRFCSNLQIHNPNFEKLCLFIIKKIKLISSMNQHTPQSIAAGTILFLVVQSNIFPLNFVTKSNVAIVTGISDVTISKINTKLIDHNKEHKIIPNQFIR